VAACNLYRIIIPAIVVVAVAAIVDSVVATRWSRAG